MKICLVSANFPPMSWPCGLADFTHRLAMHLHRSGTAVTVLTSNPAADSKREYAVQVMPGSWHYLHQRRMTRWIREQKFDAVDLQYEPAAFGHASRPLWFSLRLGTPPARVLTLHSQGLPKRGGRMWRPLQLRPWEAVVFYSEPFWKRMQARFPGRAARFFHLGFPSNIPVAVAPQLRELVTRIKAGWLDPRALVLYFGHIAPSRGIEDLLAATKALAGRGLQPQLVLASQFDPIDNEYHRNLLAKVRSDGLEGQVSFPGQLPAEQVSLMFQAADLVALPFPEGASFKNGTLAAALGHGAAIVTTLTDLTETVLRDESVMAGYQPGDVAALTEKLASLLTDVERRRRLGEGARRIGELLSWDNYVKRRVEIYRGAQAGIA